MIWHDGGYGQDRNVRVSHGTLEGWVVVGVVCIFMGLIALLIFGAYAWINFPKAWL